MSSRESEELAARRRELREELDRRRQAARAELQRRRDALGEGPNKRDRRWLWALGAIVAILIALLSDCTCSTEPAEVEVEVEEPVEVVEESEEVPAAKSPPPKLRIERLDRPEYKSEVPEVLPWVASFRLQVEARSPRLAECFVGAQRPGRLKWTAAVEPGEGRVSDFTIEPTVAEEVLTKQQRSCVIAVLSEPPYRLEGGDERSTPSRVGMVIEF